MTLNLAEALAFARMIARETAQFLIPGAGRGTADVKADGSYVTQFDLASDKRLTAAIRARYPEHAILSEEENKVFDGDEWTWILDPIDGTTNYTWGYPLWGVLIGLLHNGVPVLGVGDFPLSGEQFYACIGQGAWCNERPIKASPATTINPLHIFGVCSRLAERTKFPIQAKARIAGSSAYDMAKLADGTYVGLFNYSVAVWDVAALWPLVTEAGAICATSLHDRSFGLTTGADYGDSSVSKFSIYGGCSELVFDSARTSIDEALATS